MGKKDKMMREYLSQPDICADFIQNFVFKNHQVITEDMIHLQKNQQSVFVKNAEEGLTVKEKIRDVCAVICRDMKYLIIGIESQTDMLNIMPVRSMLYDAISYDAQIAELRKAHRKAKDLEKEDYLSGISKVDKLIPVVTVVFYYGEEPWDRSVGLFDMFDLEGISDEAVEMIQNYKINLIDIHKIENISDMKTSLGPLIELMKTRRNKQELQQYIENHREFLDKTSDELFELIAELLEADWLIEKKKECVGKGADYTMCTGMKEWLEEVFQDGEQKGREAGEQEGKREGQKLGFEQACHIIGEINHGIPVSVIASKYEIEENQVLMVIHAMRPDGK
ncbi:MAG: Rpn family recombination-promoting nuclease/putative transposase [Clostridiales bacterium]|nr:Rpn family recombination-promoting nuclease/putative transposase [Clostridiales bacterium]MDY3745208.1 Rpn family recombination-promoting nuclease/putative transposase [Lachnospiraceae bacterium]